MRDFDSPIPWSRTSSRNTILLARLAVLLRTRWFGLVFGSDSNWTQLSSMQTFQRAIRFKDTPCASGSFSQGVLDHCFHVWIGLMPQVLLKHSLRLRRVNYAQHPDSPSVFLWATRVEHTLDNRDRRVSDFVQRLCCWIEYELCKRSPFNDASGVTWKRPVVNSKKLPR